VKQLRWAPARMTQEGQREVLAARGMRARSFKPRGATRCSDNAFCCLEHTSYFFRKKERKNTRVNLTAPRSMIRSALPKGGRRRANLWWSEDWRSATVPFDQLLLLKTAWDSRPCRVRSTRTAGVTPRVVVFRRPSIGPPPSVVCPSFWVHAISSMCVSGIVDLTQLLLYVFLLEPCLSLFHTERAASLSGSRPRIGGGRSGGKPVMGIFLASSPPRRRRGGENARGKHGGTHAFRTVGICCFERRNRSRARQRRVSRAPPTNLAQRPIIEFNETSLQAGRRRRPNSAGGRSFIQPAVYIYQKKRGVATPTAAATG
jgi:hypothetical protein